MTNKQSQVIAFGGLLASIASGVVFLVIGTPSQFVVYTGFVLLTLTFMHVTKPNPKISPNPKIRSESMIRSWYMKPSPGRMKLMFGDKLVEIELIRLCIDDKGFGYILFNSEYAVGLGPEVINAILDTRSAFPCSPVSSQSDSTQPSTLEPNQSENGSLKGKKGN